MCIRDSNGTERGSRFTTRRKLGYIYQAPTKQNRRSTRQSALKPPVTSVYNYLGFRLSAAPFHLPQTLISLLFVAYLAGTWSAAQAGVLAARFGRRPVLLIAIAGMVVGVLMTLSTVLVVVLIGLLVATAGFFAGHAVASGWTGAEAITGRTQASSLYNLFYYAGSSLFGWLGGVFFVNWGWAGTSGMIAFLALVAGVLAVLLLSGRDVTRQ